MKNLKAAYVIGAIITMLGIVGCTKISILEKEADPSFKLNLQAPISKWDEAIPLGNGLTGGLLWGENNEIRFSLDRGDLWDLRPHPGFTAHGFSYETVCRLATEGSTGDIPWTRSF